MTFPATMRAMVTMGHGGLEQMVLHEDWPCPIPSDDDVLIRVGACGLNNTDVNTRSGWYSKTVTEGTTGGGFDRVGDCLLYTSPSPRDRQKSRMPSSA